jgi:DNA-binding transcriptional ArsR family regulator
MALDDPSEEIMAVEEREPSPSLFSRLRRRLHLEEPVRNEVLEGKALQIYWYLLTHPQGLAGIREIQAALEFASSGTVAYQIKKLMQAGIVSKNEQSEKYYIKEEIKTGIFSFYIRIGYRMIPRFSLYLSLFIVGLCIYFFFVLTRGDAYITDPSSWVLLFFLLLGISGFIFESLRIWSLRPD